MGSSPVHSESVTFEVPAPGDALLIHQWRNDARTTSYFSDKSKIEWEEHLKWFDRVLNDPNDFLVFALCEGRRVGVVRLEIIPGDGLALAEVGIYLDPELHGIGLGPRTLSAFPRWCVENGLPADALIARVSAENVPSQKSFELAGFDRCRLMIPGGIDIHLFANTVERYLTEGTDGVVNDTSNANELDHYVYSLDLSSLGR